MYSLIIPLLVYQTQSSFLQCSPSDSLESVEHLNDDRSYAKKRGIVCDKWPFYSGGVVKPHHHSSSSSSEEDSDEPVSLLPDSVTSDSPLYGYDDTVASHECLASNDQFCSAWVVTRRQYKDNYGHTCKRSAEATVMTDYELCLCAQDNYGDDEGTLGSYCAVWACLESAAYPTNYTAYSLIRDNDIISDNSWAKKWSKSESDSSSSSSEDFGEEYHGDYRRFVKDGETLVIDESMAFSNCWCKAASLNGKYCLNWFCQSLEHDEHGCHKSKFDINYGWFGCYTDDTDPSSTTCPAWYGFMIDYEQRDESRCTCDDDECQTWTCGAVELPLRRNYMWHNFWLAFILWGCLCGCCGTKMCFRRKFDVKGLRCRPTRMLLFFVVIAVIATIHGGLPMLIFFILIATCRTKCLYKCEKYGGCCKSKCAMSKWRAKCQAKCDAKKAAKDVEKGQTETFVTGKDGENSKEIEESVSHDVPFEGANATKSGHVRVASVDLDEMDQ